MSVNGLSAEATNSKEPRANRLRRHSALLVIVMTALIVLALFPIFAQPYYVTLVLPAFAYAHCATGIQSAVRLHRLAFVRSRAVRRVGCLWRSGVVEQARRQELRSDSCSCPGSTAVAVAIPVGLLAVRYVRIFFGILTLAFGMLFHSFLFKFYNITGGDTGIRVLRPALFGNEFSELDKTAFLIGPFYYYCLVLLVVLGFVMWCIVHSPFGLHLTAIRENPRKAEYLGVRVRTFRLAAFLISAFYCAVGGVILAINIGPGRSGDRLLDAFGRARVHDGARRVRELFWSAGGRVRLHLLEIRADVADAVLAIFPRRDARVDRDPVSARRDGRGTGSLVEDETHAMTALIETVGVSKAYGSFVALDGVSLAVASGELLSIVGPNGAGKTTLVNVLTGLLKPTSGTVRFKGQDIAGIGPVLLAKRGMARAFQLVHIFPALTVAQTIGVAVVSQASKSFRLFSSVATDAALRSRVREVAAIFGLDSKLDTESRLLSQGDKKLLDIASAFALTPEVILLDEPTSGVSSGDKHGIMRTLMEAAKQAGVQAIILVEHDMDLVAQYSTRIVAMKEGKVLADLPPNEFFNDPAIVAAVVGKLVGKMSRRAV